MMESLAKLKILLGITGSDNDDKLALVWDMLTVQVLAYLGWSSNDLPPALESIILQMAVDYFSQNNMGISGIQATAKSVKRGDTEITYNVAEAASAASFISLYSDLLYPFRRVVMR